MLTELLANGKARATVRARLYNPSQLKDEIELSVSVTDPKNRVVHSATRKFTSHLELADREKKKAFVESIASGNFHNQADKGAESALSWVMARTAACTGREVTWEET